jgi:hypothetical protein
MAIIKDAFQKARKESGKRDRRSLLLYMARAFLQGPSPDTQANKTSKPPYQVLIHHHLPSGLSWCETEKSERPIPAETLAKALCDAEIREAGDNSENEMISLEQGKRPLRDSEQFQCRRGGFQTRLYGETRIKHHENPDKGMVLINELYSRMKMQKPGDSSDGRRPPRRARRTIPRKVRRHVLERDGHCCQAPGCSNEHFTVVHHLDPVALGGTDDPRRLITLCWHCHDLVHEGKLTVKGDAPGDLVWG